MAELDMRGVSLVGVLNAQVRAEVRVPGFAPVRAFGYIFRFWVAYRTLGYAGSIRHVELAGKGGAPPKIVVVRSHLLCAGARRDLDGWWLDCECDADLAVHDVALCDVCEQSRELA